MEAVVTSASLEFWLVFIVAIALWLLNLLTIKMMRRKSNYLLVSLFFVLSFILIAILGIHMNIEQISQWSWIQKMMGG